MKKKKFGPTPLLLCDFYKISHREQYPKGTELIYSTWTPRGSRMKGVEKIVHFGVQKFIKEFLIDYFNENFFQRDETEVIEEYKRVIKFTLGVQDPDCSHIEMLHRLGYLPLSIKSLMEGTLVPIRVPCMTIHNTKPQFFWLTNYIETLLSCEIWQSSTSATIAFEYRKILNEYANKTIGNTQGVEFQGHDFSMRGMSSVSSAVSSGLGHLLSFVGTDTIPAICASEYFYNADIEKELIGTSIPATEHSVMCAYGKDEISSYKNLMTNVYPKGFLSIVSDTWDFWSVIENVIIPLKECILNRDGKIVIRPDSGDPVKIICGDLESENQFARKGLIESLWDIFGGTISEKGYKVLDSHSGAIYGDSITIERASQICKFLKEKGFASINIVFGIGSYTYQYNTRDTFMFAMKSTLCKINGEEMMLFKNPKTDDGTKMSAKGAVSVFRNGNDLDYQDCLHIDQILTTDELKEVYRDGQILIEQNFSDIKNRLI